MSKSRIVAALVAGSALVPAAAAVAQQTNCGQAVFQLQQYAMQVNAIVQAEYNQAIPMRCGYDQQCQYTNLSYLNAWYQQQANYINNWYAQINMACTQAQAPTPPPAPVQAQQQQPNMTAPPPRIENRRIETLQVDREDKTVRIQIPSTPQGYR